MDSSDGSLEKADDAASLQPEGAESTSSPRKDYWALLRNVFRAVTLFRTHEAQLHDLDELLLKIRQIPTDPQYRREYQLAKERSPSAVAVRELRRQQILFACVEKGSPEDLHQLQELIDGDPNQFLLPKNSSELLVNKKNHSGLTPLYLASKHGNTQVIQCLIDCGVNHLLCSDLGKDQESALEVAARWGHTGALQALLTLRWPNAFLQKAKKAARSKTVSELVGAHLKDKACCVCF